MAGRRRVFVVSIVIIAAAVLLWSREASHQRPEHESSTSPTLDEPSAASKADPPVAEIPRKTVEPGVDGGSGVGTQATTEPPTTNDPTRPSSPAEESDAAPDGTPSKPGSSSRAVVGGAVISGRVRFEGPKPAPVIIDMSAHPDCDRVANEKQRTVAEIGDKSGLAGVFIVVASRPSATRPRRRKPELRHQGCQLDPQLIVGTVAEPIRYTNLDDIFHTVHVFAEDQERKLAAPKKGTTFDLLFGRPVLFSEVTCDVHPWESAWLVVTDHPFVAVTGPDGAFAIAGIDRTTTLRVDAFHPTLGSQTLQVAPDTDIVEFVFTAADSVPLRTGAVRTSTPTGEL